MATVFLKLAYDEHREGKYFAIEESKIETLNVSDSYDRHGQKISAGDAGDYLEILQDCEFENEEGEIETFEKGTNLSAYDNRTGFDTLVEKYEDGKEIRIHRTEFQGFNYHDGHNWRTVSVSTIDDDNEYEIEGDEEIIARLNEALENKEFHHETPGIKVYRHKDVEIKDSCWQGTWEDYTLTIDNDFDDEE